MKTIILAGGKGTRISEESRTRPKPMVTIGGIPILWHIMKIYDYYGFSDFIICCGYKGEYIKKWCIGLGNQSGAARYELHSLMEDGRVRCKPGNENTLNEHWRITCANTGLETLTAGRVLSVKKHVGDDEEFMLTYGDGVGDVNIQELIDYHHRQGKLLTISVTQPEGRFGAIGIRDDGSVESFQEKARKDQAFVNIGFMVANKRLFDYLGDGSEMLERGPFERLAAEGQIAAYKHSGFWSPMDNVHDREYLEELWKNGAPWIMR